MKSLLWPSIGAMAFVATFMAHYHRRIECLLISREAYSSCRWCDFQALIFLTLCFPALIFLLSVLCYARYFFPLPATVSQDLIPTRSLGSHSGLGKYHFFSRLFFGESYTHFRRR